MFRLFLKFFIIYFFVSFGFVFYLGFNDLEFLICIGNIFCLGFFYIYVYIIKCIVLWLFFFKKIVLYYFWKKLKYICISFMYMISLKNSLLGYLYYNIIYSVWYCSLKVFKDVVCIFIWGFVISLLVNLLDNF